jgi:hypothetical protein
VLSFCHTEANFKDTRALTVAYAGISDWIAVSVQTYVVLERVAHRKKALREATDPTIRYKRAHELPVCMVHIFLA